MIIISSDVSTISLDVVFSSKEGSELFIERGTSIVGFDYHYKYGQKKSFTYRTLLTTFSDGQLVNEWWEDNKNLTLIDTFTNSTAVQISNDRIPFASLQNRPYQNQYNQSIQFTES